MAKNTMFLYGKNPVIERLKANPKSIRKILLREDFNEQRVLELIELADIKVERIDRKEFDKKKHAERVQGVIAIVEKFRYDSVHNMLEKNKTQEMSFVLIDGLNDPQNLGLIIRTLACMGKFSVILPGKGSCHITDTVLHVANGGENYVPVCVSEDIVSTLLLLKQSGYWCVGAVVKAEKSLYTYPMRFPACIVVGPESKGISPNLIELLDATMQIPMPGACLSYNVAVATTMMCSELMRQKEYNA